MFNLTWKRPPKTAAGMLVTELKKENEYGKISEVFKKYYSRAAIAV